MSDTRAYCSVRLEGHLFGFDIHSVKEVNTQTLCTPVPHAPAAVLGYLNLRGQIVLVLDLRQLLGLDALRVTGDTRLVIFKPAVGPLFGVLVDQIADIVRVSAEQVETWSAERLAQAAEAIGIHKAGALVRGVARLDRELLLVLDASRLLASVTERLG